MPKHRFTHEDFNKLLESKLRPQPPASGLQKLKGLAMGGGKRPAVRPLSLSKRVGR